MTNWMAFPCLIRLVFSAGIRAVGMFAFSASLAHADCLMPVVEGCPAPSVALYSVEFGVIIHNPYPQHTRVQAAYWPDGIVVRAKPKYVLNAGYDVQLSSQSMVLSVAEKLNSFVRQAKSFRALPAGTAPPAFYKAISLCSSSENWTLVKPSKQDREQYAACSSAAAMLLQGAVPTIAPTCGGGSFSSTSGHSMTNTIGGEFSLGNDWLNAVLQLAISYASTNEVGVQMKCEDSGCDKISGKLFQKKWTINGTINGYWTNSNSEQVNLPPIQGPVAVWGKAFTKQCCVAN